MAAALNGVRVLELATGVAGAFCGKLLAGLGADVVKIEPPEGDPVRHAGPFPGDAPSVETSGLHLHLDTAKRSAQLDLEAQAGIFDDLLARADVLLLSHQRRDLRDAGLDLAAIRGRHPHLIVTNITPFGMTGPYAEFEGGELVCYALSGYAMLTGAPDRQPLKSYGSLLHYQAGLHATLGTLAALRTNAAGNCGQLVDVSVMEAGTFLLGGVEQQAFFYGRVARRNGTRLLGFPPEHSYPSTIRPCRDGYVHCHSNNRFLDLLGALIPHPRLRDASLLAAMMAHADEIDAIMDEWLSDKDRRDVVSRAQELRLPFTEVMTPAEVMSDPHHVERGSFVTVDHPGAGPVLQPAGPVRMSATPWRVAPAPMLGEHTVSVVDELAGWDECPEAASPPANSAKPLAGVRVVDFTNAVAGPLASAILADLGAEVIKVEAPAARPRNAKGTAPLADAATDEPWNRIMLYNGLNHGKRAITLDAGRPEGRELFLKLAATADVFLHNFSPRAMDNLDLHYDTVAAVNPAIVYVSMPAFGLSGPYRNRGSYGPGVDAMSGFSHLTGYADGPPIKPGNFFCDQNAALLASISTLAALEHRRRTGLGQHVELAMIEGEFQVIADALMDFAMNGRERLRAGNDAPGCAPHDTYRCMGDDAWVAIAVSNDTQWRALCQVIGRADLLGDPRFKTPANRFANRHHLRNVIEPWTAERTPVEAQEALQTAGVPAGAVLTALELLQDPHSLERHGYEYVDTPNVGPTPYPRLAFLLSETPVPVSGPAPRYGEANRYIFGDVLGLDDAALEALEANGLIARIPPDGAHH